MYSTSTLDREMLEQGLLQAVKLVHFEYFLLDLV